MVPMLFEVPDNSPPPSEWYDAAARRWCNTAGTLFIQGGIPFRICGEWTYAGRPFVARPLVEWAAKHGTLRDNPLEPQDNPLQAADDLYNKIIAGGVPQCTDWWQMRPLSDRNKTAIRDDLRAQAIRTLPKALQDRRDLSWDDLRNQVAQTGICWDRKTQAFVLSGESVRR